MINRIPRGNVVSLRHQLHQLLFQHCREPLGRRTRRRFINGSHGLNDPQPLSASHNWLRKWSIGLDQKVGQRHVECLVRSDPWANRTTNYGKHITYRGTIKETE